MRSTSYHCPKVIISDLFCGLFFWTSCPLITLLKARRCCEYSYTRYTSYVSNYINSHVRSMKRNAWSNWQPLTLRQRCVNAAQPFRRVVYFGSIQAWLRFRLLIVLSSANSSHGSQSRAMEVSERFHVLDLILAS